MIKISIVTASLNQGQFIEQTFKSILIQKGNFKIEYILVDGLSTDQTRKLIKKYQPIFKKTGIEFKIIIEKDTGQANAISKGFKIATGQVWAFLNADDFYTPKALQNVVTFFEKEHDYDWAFGGWNIVNQSGKKFQTSAPKNFSGKKFQSYGFNIGQPSCFFKKAIYKKVGGLNEKLHLTLDYDLWLRFYKISQPGIIPAILSNMRYHQQSKSSQNMLKHNHEAYLTAKKYLPKNNWLYFVLNINYIIGWLMIKLNKNISQQVK